MPFKVCKQTSIGSIYVLHSKKNLSYYPITAKISFTF
jgi:hypothetical protein